MFTEISAFTCAWMKIWMVAAVITVVLAALVALYDSNTMIFVE